jgi:hypothetical protein
MIPANVSINPKSMNLIARGRWVTTHIELPEGYSVNDINASSIFLNNTIPAEPAPTVIEDYDGDIISDLMVKFNRTQVISYVLSHLLEESADEKSVTVALTLQGQLNDGTQFQGSDTIRIVLKFSQELSSPPSSTFLVARH